MSKTLAQKPICFFDTETTGLEPGRHEIIEVAIIRVLPEGNREVFTSKIKPARLSEASPKALEINGYTDDAWADAPAFSAVAERITGMLKGSVIVGHNVGFDIGFLEAELKSHGLKGFGHHKVDTMTLAYEHLAPLGLESLALDKIRDFLGWSKDGAHTALFDAETCERLYGLLARAGWFVRLRVKLARRFGWRVA